MKSPFYFIVKPADGKGYSNSVRIEGVDVVVNSSEEDHKFATRLAEVVSVPSGYSGDIRPGDTLLVHHNVFKFYNDVRGERRSGRSHISDDMFFVDSEQFYLYKSKGDWHVHGRYCFVKPNEAPLTGEVVFINDTLASMGLSVGDVVMYTPDSEYEFVVDGVLLYRVFDHQIVSKV